MRFYAKSRTAVTVQLNKNELHYVNRSIQNGTLVVSGTSIGDILSQGFGWFKIVAEASILNALNFVRRCVRRIQAERNAEIRALLAISTGAKVLSVSITDSPYVQYTLDRIQPLPQ